MKNFLMNPFKEFLAKRKQKAMLKELDRFVEDQGVEMIEFVKKASRELIDAWKVFMGDINDVFAQMGIKTVLVERDSCTFAEFAKLLAKNKVAGSDCVAVVKEKFDGKLRFVAAYMEGDDFIKQDANCFVILITGAIDSDFKAVFKDSNIVKLK